MERRCLDDEVLAPVPLGPAERAVRCVSYSSLYLSIGTYLDASPARIAALERATQTSLLRFHLSSTRTQNEAYLTAVERARTNKKIEEKAASRGKQAKKRGAEEDGEESKRKRFRQRERVDLGEKEKRSAKDGEGALQSVLGRLF